jgi:Ca2+-binding EF-hand superfamily protein
MFIMLDTSKDGLISQSELEAGLDTVLKKFKTGATDYKELLQSMDQDGNGEIDY